MLAVGLGIMGLVVMWTLMIRNISVAAIKQTSGTVFWSRLPFRRQFHRGWMCKKQGDYMMVRSCLYVSVHQCSIQRLMCIEFTLTVISIRRLY